MVSAPRRACLLGGSLAAATAPLTWLSACASLDEASLTDGASTQAAAQADTRSGAVGGGVGGAGSAGGAPLLTPWQVIRGGWRRDAHALPPAGATPPPIPGGGLASTGARLNLMLPIGVAARDDVLLIADGGLRSVLRGLRSQDSLSPWVGYPGPVAGQGASLVITSDFSVFLAAPQSGEVMAYDVRGRLVRRYRDEARAARPVAVAVDRDMGRVFVADAQTGRVAVFAMSGEPIETWGGSGASASLQSATALAMGPDGLHVVDRAAQQVVVFDSRGGVAAAYGEGSLTRPRAMAVDIHGRCFVSDDADQTISVFWRGDRVARYAGSGPGSAFRGIEALAIDGNQLYVADAPAGVVRVLLIAPPSLSSSIPSPATVPR